MDIKRIKQLFLVISLLISSLSGQVFAQTSALLHQQSPTEAPVHAQGKHESLSFMETYGPPPVISTYGNSIEWMFRYTSWVAFGFFCIVAGALAYFIFAYRERPGHKAYYTHGTSKANNWTTRALDIAVFISLDLVLIVGSFSFTSKYLWKAMPSGPEVVRVQIMPQQWMWNFRYAGSDGNFGTPDDIVSNHLLRIPRDRPVVVQMKSRDVIHGFMVPNVRMQMDALPGSVTKFWFDANRTGDFEIMCMHLCGAAHYKMKGFLRVMESSDFDDWAKESSQWAAAQFDPDDKQTHWGWAWGL